jgi:predicted Zn-dependent protease
MRIALPRSTALVLVISVVFLASLPSYGRNNLNNPGKIGHRTAALRTIIPPAKEMEIGKEYAAEFANSVEMVKGPRVERYVTHLTENVVNSSDVKGSLTVKIVKSPEVDAFSIPGGFVYLTSGLLLAADDEDEIAGAIAHQVAHAAMRSRASRVTKMTLLNYATIPLINVPMAAPQMRPRLRSASNKQRRRFAS